MPHYVIERTAAARSTTTSKSPVKGAKVLVVGVAYKKNIDDSPREPRRRDHRSPRADVGAAVSYHDPLVPRFPHMRRSQEGRCSPWSFPLQRLPPTTA
jgi:UDP-N-acetyl-D-glucosamine dehydrogenase